MTMFKVGDRVVMKKTCYRMFGAYHSTTGTVVGVKPYRDQFISIKRDGLKRTERWHKNLWKLEKKK